ncbi:MAG TPA: PhaM family polyhydroxyalkanoate granule multifunctional regulatory protein [Burkholderiales bacterium]|nr:PhaM family polyhydroxyalkanoate granule multifunctional regulatory protein [Burkholderiales bacterium]
MSQSPDPFEFLKSLWGPMGLPMAGMIAPTLNVSDIDKRIADLKSVESWLNMNLNVLRMTIQGLEMRKSGPAAMQGAATRPTAPGVAAGHPAGAFAEAWWSALQQPAPPDRKDPTEK